MSRVLLVEDEEHLAGALAYNLRNAGYDVDAQGTGDGALERLGSERYDLVILDVMLPGKDGFQVLREARLSGIYTPVILLTARDLPQDVVQGLESGADDYLTKPFDLDELLARVRVALRRQVWHRAALEGQAAGAEEMLRIGDWQVDLQAARGRKADGRELTLTTREVAILRALAAREGEAVSRATLLREAWGVTGALVTRTVDNFLVRLRRYFEEDPARPRYFQSVRGVGYRFVRQ
ncbi:MAG: response regulator transcription factor [Planctomycetes bacterium]|nr:response regulator transcription factor [Planctomycetota bacterium]